MKMMNRKQPARSTYHGHTALVCLTGFVLAGTLGLLGSGCAAMGYRLGTTLPPGIKTVYVPTFVNTTSEPQLEAETTGATIAELQKDGNLGVVNERDADSILTVELVEVTQDPLRYERNDVKSADEYRLTITARITFTRRDTGKKLVDGLQVTGKATFDVAGDLATAKRAAIPDAARDLAHNVVESVVEYW